MAQSQQAAKTQLLASLPDLLQTTDNEIITPAILAVNDIDERRMCWPDAAAGGHQAVSCFGVHAAAGSRWVIACALLRTQKNAVPCWSS